MGLYYRDYSDYLSERFQWKMQKLTVDAGFSCPNRDGTKGTGGCSYCNNASFSPSVAPHSTPVAIQLAEAKKFFARKYPSMHYLAYFQSYTNTHGDPDRLIGLYREALSVDDVEGLIIGTRPDCINSELLELLSDINRWKRVIIEYGAESSHDSTLATVNRCHTWDDTLNAVRMTHEAGIDVGLHFIMGLPGETLDMMMTTVDAINTAAPDTVKFHQLQLIRGTRLTRQIENGELDIQRFTVDQYIDLCCDIIDRLDKSIAIERFTSSSPADLLVYPRWGLKNYQFTNLLNNRLRIRSKVL